MGQGILTKKSCNRGVPWLLGGVGPPGVARALSGLAVKPESLRQHLEGEFISPLFSSLVYTHWNLQQSRSYLGGSREESSQGGDCPHSDL